MIKQLRRKLIAACMISLAIVLAVILGGVNLMLGACILCGCAGALLCLASVLRGGKKVRPT